MTSEEDYLDNLLNNVINTEPHERSMQDIMRSMGVYKEPEEVDIIEEKPQADTNFSDEPQIGINSEEVIGIYEEDANLLLNDVETDTTEPVTETLNMPTPEILADMLDVLDDSSTYTDEVLPMDIEIPLEEEIAISIAEDLPVEEIPVEDLPVEDLPIEELSVEDLPVEDLPVEELSIEDIPLGKVAIEEENPMEMDIEIPLEEEIAIPITEDLPVEEIPAEEIPAEEIPAEEIPVEEIPVEDLPVEEIPVEEIPVEDLPIEDILIEEEISGEPSDDYDNMSDEDLLKMLGEATSAEDFVMPESRLSQEPTQEPIIEDLTAEDMTTGDLAAEDLVAEDLAAEDLAVEESLAEESMAEESITEESITEEPITDENTAEELSDKMVQEDEPSIETEGVDENLLDMLNDIETESQDNMEIGDEIPMDENQTVGPDDSDIMKAIEEMSDSDSDSETEISDVEKLEATSESDEDLLALLEGIDENATDENVEETSAFDIDPGEGEIEESGKKKKKKKGFLLSLPFFKKKNKKDSDVSEEIEEEPIIGASDSEVIEASASELDNILSGIEEVDLADEDGNPIVDIKEKNAKASDKKPGFFARLLAFLTEDIDEDEEDIVKELSNEEIIAQVDEENAEEEKADDKGKKAKKKKDKKGKKKGAEAPPEGDEESEDGEGNEEAPKKAKKAKKEKAPKEPKEKIPEKKVLSRKAFIGLVAFCMTVIAAIVILSFILPDYVDKKQARKAYYLADYETVYANLYNKELNDSDKILFKRAESVMLLKRRLDSHNNRIAIGKNAEALDSLLEGVQVYLKRTNEEGIVFEDLVVIYNEILGILSDKYHISAEQAIEIYAIEDDTEYTKVLFNIISAGGYDPAMIQNTSEELLGDDASGDIMPEETAVETTDESVVEETTDDVQNDTSEESNDPEENVEYEEITYEDMLPAEEDL